MDTRQLKRSAILALISILIALSTLLTATYAWFTGVNRQVSTSRAEAKTGSSEATLLLSETTDFSAGTSVADIVQVNTANAEKLMPVSTDDLTVFLTGTGIDGGDAEVFRLVENEEYYYHGRIYLMAEASGDTAGESMLLYFNSGADGGEIFSAEDTRLLHAARVGLVFREQNGTGETTHILRLSDAEGTGTMNTVVDGVVQESGIVLHSTAQGEIAPVADPARLWTDFAIGDNAAAPEDPLCTLTLNSIYTLDIYLYLEGCDPDCSNDISLSAGDLSLWFFGLLG